MHFPIPNFVPVPSPETMRLISVISLIAGICLVGAGVLFRFLGGKRSKTVSWIFIGAGALLMLNHSIQLLF